jgi:hypothetical protein
MAKMTDPMDALKSFQQAFRAGSVRPQQCELDKRLLSTWTIRQESRDLPMSE